MAKTSLSVVLSVALTTFATATIAIAQQAASAAPTIHFGTMDFANGTLTVPDLGSRIDIRGSSPLWDADGRQLVYLSTTSDAGGKRTTLKVESKGITREVVPDVSIDETISLTSNRDMVLVDATTSTGDSGVFQVDLRSGKSTVVAINDRASFVSADKRSFYFFRGEGPHHELVEHDLSSGKARTVVTYEHSQEIPESAYVSPDRARLYYRMPDPGAKTPEPQSRIVERDLASGRERDLLSGRLGHLRPSPDGRYAVVRQDDPAGKWVAMRLLPLVEPRPASDLMRTENPNLFFSFWSPDSRSVILQMPDNGRPTSWWVPLDGRSPKPLSQFIRGATVHPNGKTIAFATNDK